jgi:hypothetical protein
MIRSYFGSRCRDTAGNRVTHRWIAEDENAILFNIETGKVVAVIDHDGCRKYYPTVYVSLRRAIWISRENQGYLVSLLALPRLTMDLIRSHEMDAAVAAVEYAIWGIERSA